MLFLILLMFLPHTVSAETVLIPAPGASTREYQARLQGTEFVSPSQVYTDVFPSVASRENLLAAYADAQKAYLENTLPLAQSKFESVVAMAANEDWGKTEREVLLASYLRLAQIDSVKRDAYLASALQLGPGLSADKTLFPPPLLQRFEKLREELPKINPRTLFDVSAWQRLLINGVPCSRQSCPEFVNLPAPVRVTFLSDKWIPQTVQVALADLSKARPEQTAWLQGPCGKPAFHTRADMFSGKTAFWSLTCAGLDLKPQVALASSKETAGGRPQQLSFFEPAPQTRTPLYKNKWVWAGAAVVTAALVISLSQKKGGGEDRQSSTAYGF